MGWFNSVFFLYNCSPATTASVLPDGVEASRILRGRREGDFPDPAASGALINVRRLLYAPIDVGLPDGRQTLVDISSSNKAKQSPALPNERGL